MRPFASLALIFVLAMVSGIACEAAGPTDSPANTQTPITLPTETSALILTPTSLPTTAPTSPATPASASLPTPVPFQTTSFTVAAGQQYEVPLDVQQGSTIFYRFSSGFDFDFRLVDPIGNWVTWADQVSSTEGSVTVKSFGRYT